MNFSQKQTKIEQPTNKQVQIEPPTNPVFVESELSADDLKAIVGGGISIDLGGSDVSV